MAATFEMPSDTGREVGIESSGKVGVDLLQSLGTGDVSNFLHSCREQPPHRRQTTEGDDACGTRSGKQQTTSRACRVEPAKHLRDFSRSAGLPALWNRGSFFR